MAKTLEKMIRNEKRTGTWSKWLVKCFNSTLPALSFSFGSALLRDMVADTLRMMATENEDVLDYENSVLECYLPERYKDRYTVEFLKAFLVEIDNLRRTAAAGEPIIAEKPIQEIILRAVVMEADDFADFMSEGAEEGSEYEMFNVEIERHRDSWLWKDWPYELFGDADVDMVLFSYDIPDPDYPEITTYAFRNWFEKMFWQSSVVEEVEGEKQESANA